ncbi:putative translation initiation factor IF-2 [Iris pallida]|uniref:Translation initiation factor IF-2 n=1 Tax=Iris pallida TaxID=29817 RepID=A0AAX6GG85_IRIPA|nr:putative translation initiation factor IF-2 [Iris pallida]
MASNGGYSSGQVKLAAASAAVLAAAAAAHLFGPSMVLFGVSEVPRIYGSFLAWLTPPYLYFVINGIIISIAASSRFQKPGPDSADALGPGSAQEVSVASPIVVMREYVAPPPVLVVTKPEYAVPAEYSVPLAVEMKPEYVVPEEEYAVPAAPVEMKAEYVAPAEEETKEEEEEFVLSRSSWAPKKRESPPEIPSEYSFLKTEKPLVSSRLGRRKSIKFSPEAGKALGVARPKRNETLETTWKNITDGRAVPLTRHLRKLDTWETHHNDAACAPRAGDPAPVERQVCKSETFNERNGRKPAAAAVGSFPLPVAARLRKEPSLGQDDLNRRVEAFIKKFNEEMRLQRQGSFNHYVDMINSGSH